VHREVIVLSTFNCGHGVDKDVAQLHLSFFSTDLKRLAFFDPHRSTVFIFRFLILDKAAKGFFLVFDWHAIVLAEIILILCLARVYRNFASTPTTAAQAPRTLRPKRGERPVCQRLCQRLWVVNAFGFPKVRTDFPIRHSHR
jgi:hypothetical protein